MWRTRKEAVVVVHFIPGERCPIMSSPFLVFWVVALLLLRVASSQYSSDQCSWRGSGLSHETHSRDVEQVYLRCSQGDLQWLYPTGAIIVNLRPNVAASAATGRLSACIRPLADSCGSNVYLEQAGELQLLLAEQDQALGQVRCFDVRQGALFIEAVPQRDISRKITAFRYELVNEQPSLSAPCQPCGDAEVLLAMCTSDFVARGRIQGVEEGEERTSVTVVLSQLYRQKSRVFAAGSGHMRSWTGRVLVPRQCGVQPGEGDFLFMGSIHFGEAWLGCAPRYRDFMRLYREALDQGTNPCQMKTD